MSTPVFQKPIPFGYLDTDTALTANSDVKVPSQKATKAYADTKVPSSYLDTDTSLAANSDSKVATQKAVKTYVDTQNSAKSSILVTAEPAGDHFGSGITITLTAGVNMAFGDVGYIASTGKVLLIDADAIATMSGVVMCISATINQDAGGTFLMMGVARDDSWNWTVGGLIYATVTGTSGNTLSQTAPTGTDDVVQVLGVATHADRMMFMPQLVQIELT